MTLVKFVYETDDDAAVPPRARYGLRQGDEAGCVLVLPADFRPPRWAGASRLSCRAHWQTGPQTGPGRTGLQVRTPEWKAIPTGRRKSPPAPPDWWNASSRYPQPAG